MMQLYSFIRSDNRRALRNAWGELASQNTKALISVDKLHMNHMKVLQKIYIVAAT